LFFDKVVIVGVGLLGGSIGLALKSGKMCGTIAGVGRGRASIEAALEIGAIDEVFDDLSDAAAGADLIVVCTPVGSVVGAIAEMESRIDDDCIITDVGSTKLEIVRAVEQMPRAGTRFVGSHPMAGSEKKGARHASADLFAGAKVIVTPGDRTDPDAADAVMQLWESFGSEVVVTDPETHDRIVARTSHLPHIAAALLVANLRALDEEHCGLVAGGFLDTTRVASSDPEMWADICLNNVEGIREAIVDLQSDLDEIDEYLDEGDYEQVFAFFESMKFSRDSFNDESPNG
jgi:prephenate dehydrogenase